MEYLTLLSKEERNKNKIVYLQRKFSIASKITKHPEEEEEERGGGKGRNPECSLYAMDGPLSVGT